MSSITLSRADGTVTADWPAPDGATKYHVTYTTDGGGSWHAPVNGHDNVQTNTLTFTADNAKTYVVGVRAGNSAGWSGWRNSPSSGPYTPTPPGIVLQDAGGAPLTALSVPEGGEASYRVKLAAAPAEDTEVCVALYTRDDDDPDITFKGQAADVVSIKLTFTPADWNTAQTVTLTAAYDADSVNGARGVTHDAREYYSGHVDITATEIDTVALPAAPAGLTATAGDGAVTLSWDDPSDASITGYQYNVNHNATSTGNFSGWSAWTALDGADAATSHTFDGLTNGREYRYHLRAVNAAGSGPGAPNAPPWFAAATPRAYDDSLAVDNVFVDPGDGYLDISWSAADGATHYDVRAKESGVNDWHPVAWKVAGTTYRYTTDKTIDYVAVRALSASSVGPWTELSRMPAHDFMNVASGVSVPAGVASASASIQSGASIQAQLAAPTGFTIARRLKRGVTPELNLNWTSSTSPGTTAYNIICAPGQSGWAWHACGWDASGTLTYTSVPSSQTRPVTVTHYERKAGESPHVAGKYKMSRSRHYRVSIRAVNANPGDASEWVNSGVIHPIFPYVRDFTYTRSAGSIAMSWTPNYWTTGYEIDCAEYDSTQTPYVPYTPAAPPSPTRTTPPTSTPSPSRRGRWARHYSIDDSKRYDIRICSTNATGRACMLAPWIHPNPSLTASAVTGTTATLTIGNHSGQWWYKANTGPDATCSTDAVTGTSENLTGLTAGTVYVYTAYGKTGCNSADLLATATFGTIGTVSASNLGETTDATAFALAPNAAYAQEFTTGSASGGYTLSSVKVAFSAVFDASVVTVAIHGKQSNGHPETTARATLTGTPVSDNDVTFTCTAGNNDNCCFGREHLVLRLRQRQHRQPCLLEYHQGRRADAVKPSGNGWSITDAAHASEYGWVLHPGSSAMKISVSATGGTASASLTATSTSLTIGNYTGSWYYQANAAPHATCQGPVTGASQTISGLTSGTSYTYKAYADSACTVLLATAAAFTPNT